MLFKIFKDINNYKTFFNFMETSFPNTLYLDLAKIYRDCSSVGKGFINADVLYSVLNENMFFVNILKKRQSI
jgi:hypothetical protein